MSSRSRQQRAEVLAESVRVARASTHRKRSVTPAHGKPLVAFAELLDPVDQQPPTWREQAPERDGRGRRVPLDPASPALSPVRNRARVAEHDKSSAGAQRGTSESTARRRTRRAPRPHLRRRSARAHGPGSPRGGSRSPRRRAARRLRNRERSRSRTCAVRRPPRAREPPCPPCRPPRARARSPHSSPGGAMKQLVGSHVREDEAHTSPGSRSSGTSTAFASRTQTRSASAPHTVSVPIRSPTRRREHPGPSSSTTPTSS